MVVTPLRIQCNSPTDREMQEFSVYIHVQKELKTSLFCSPYMNEIDEIAP